MKDAGSVIVWIVLTALPVIAAWKRYWTAFAVYAVGWILFWYQVLFNRSGGWEDLALIAALVVVILPIYALASILWGISAYRRARLRKQI